MPATSRPGLRCIQSPRAVAAALFFVSAIAVAQTTDPAPTVLPIADSHFHLMPFMNADELQAHMDKNKVMWTVSATAIGNSKESPWERDSVVKQKLGPRFVPSTGGREFYAGEKSFGTAFYTDAEQSARRAAFAGMEALLKPGGGSISETFPNAETSSADSLRRRRVPTDAPFFVELMDIAVRNKLPLPMHMEWHPESVAGLSRLLESTPQGVVVLNHCGKTSVAEDIRPMLEKHPNLYCDLSFRSPPQQSPQDPKRTIFWGDSLFRKAGLKPDWKKLIEDFPDRFMVGIDDVQSWSQYDEVAGAIRSGLLAQLSPPVAEKLAWRNAVKVFNLPDISDLKR